MSRIKEKVSQLVPGQFPEFIRENYDTFTTFVEAYYQFLEQDSGALELVQNARSYNDIDTTTSDFVQYFLTNYIKDIPSNVLANKRMLVKKISDLYSAKGSDMSFKMLFRILYDSNVEVSHPYDNVLRPSDGTWEQRVSLRVQLTYGSTSDILDRFVTYVKDGITYSEPIVRVKALGTPGLYEIFLKSSSKAPYALGDEISVYSTAGVIFAGIIKPTTTGYSISYGGTGFKAGQIFQINAGGGIDSLVRILRVDSNGSITLLKILNYGYGFTNDITINLYNNLLTVGQTETIGTYTPGFTDEFIMMSPDVAPNASRYFYSDYVTTGYSGTRLAYVKSTQTDSTGDTFISTTNDPTVAIINFTMGAVAKYPGQYVSTRGFLSEPEVRLQDVNQYQPFAYELQSELDISQFYDTVLKLVHPAGTKLFNNRTITTTANIAANVNVLTSRNVLTQLNETFAVLDQATLYFGKLISNTDNTTSSDNVVLNIGKRLTDGSDNVIASEAIVLNTGKYLTDNTAPVEAIVLNTGKALTDGSDNVSVIESITVLKVYYRSADDNTAPTDTVTLSINPVYTDNTTTTDTIAISTNPVYSDNTTITDTTTLSTQPVYTDNVTPADSIASFNIGTFINNNDSNVSFTESVTGVLLNYTDATGGSGYFANVYAGSTVISV